MKELLTRAAEYLKNHRHRKLWVRVVSAMACVVVFCTVYALILPVITLEGATYCGQEEHVHDDSCYESRLICGQEESEGHTHTEECYTVERELICGQEESEEHTHTEECYQEKQVLACGQEETDGHTHTADCYENVMACGKEEHKHTDICYSDKSADVETAAVWEKTLEDVELTGVWADDVLAVAESQIGYTESTANYEVTDAGKRKGYTRYGAWYGDPYGDWCAMFASFCLNYAGISEEAFPYEANCDWWIQALQVKENELNNGTDLYQEAEDYTPVPGDLIFFDRDGDGISEHVGLVVEVTEKTTGWSVKTIEGNSSDQVKNNTYSLTNEDILGYGILPENPAMADETEDKTEEDIETDTAADINEIGNEDTSQASIRSRLSYYTAEAAELAASDYSAANNGISMAAEEGEDDYIDFTNWITGVSIQYRPNEWSDWKAVTEETEIEKEGDLRFNIAYTVPGNQLSSEKNTIIYHLPSNITLVTEKSGNVTNNAGQVVGTYQITTNGVITITFNEEYVKDNQLGEQIEGHVFFEASVENITTDDDGKVILPFNDTVKLDLKVEEESKETSDLQVTKGISQYDSETGKITYTITVTSANGTGSDVTLTDTMTNAKYSSGLTVKNKDGGDVTVTAPTEGTTSFDLTLPKMEAGDSYTITYTADFVDPGNYTEIDVKNSMTANSTDTNNKPINDSAVVDLYIDHDVLQKTGVINSDGTITWTVSVNESHQNIGGWILSDTLNGQPFTGQVTISPAVNGQTTITLPYTFPAGTTESYTVTYTTPADKAVGAYTTTNVAALAKPGGETVGTATGTGAWGGQYNPLSKTSSTITESADGTTATIHWIVTIDASEGAITGPWTYNDELWNDQWFTEEQFNAIQTAINNLNLNATVTATTKDGKTIGFKIDFPNTLEKGQTITFEYDSTAPIEGVTSEKSFTNSSNINQKVWSNPTAKYRPSRPTIEKKDNRASGDSTSHDIGDDKIGDGVLEWLVKVTMPADYNGGALTIVENLPEGVELTYLEILADGVFGARDISTVGEHKTDGYTITTALDGQKITISIPEDLSNNPNLKEFRFVVRVKISDDFAWTNKTEDGVLKTGNFENLVSLLDKDGNILGTDVQTQVITKDENRGVLDKTGSEDEGNIVHYQLVINPEGKLLLEGVDYLTLTDVLTYAYDSNDAAINVSLVPESVAVYRMNPDGTKGEKFTTAACPYTYTPSIIEKWESWEKEQRTLSIQIPDETPLIIEYSYKISGPLNYSLSTSNTATIEGVTISDGENHSGITVKIDDSGATANVEGVTICKVDKDNNGIVLSGAEFELQMWDSAKKTYEPILNEDGSKKVVTTGANGMFNVEMAFNTAYRLIETKAPEGYHLDSMPYDFLITDTDTTTHPVCKPDNFTADGGHELTPGAVIYYPNERSDTDISVIKRWVDNSGVDVTDKQTGSISFNLHQIGTPEGYNAGGEGGDAAFSVSIDREGGSCAKNSWYVYPKENGTVSYPAGTTVTFTIMDRYGDKDAPNLTLNGNYLSFTRSSGSTWQSSWGTYYTESIYTYSFTLSSGANTIAGKITNGNEETDWVVSEPTVVLPPTTSSGDTPQPTDIVIGTHTVSASNGWAYTVTNLPKKETKTVDGTEVTYYYTYYIEEVGGNPTYLNNDTVNGITYGAITITNNVNDAPPPEYELPETGGRGTTWYTFGGLVLLLLSALWYRKSHLGKGEA